MKMKLTTDDSAVLIPAGDRDDGVILDEEVARLVLREVRLAECEHGTRF